MFAPPVHVTQPYAILLFLNVALSNELNRTRNNWTPLNSTLLDRSGTWSFDDNLGTITQDISTTPSEASIVLPDKQWYIGSESLYINYSYSIDYLGSTSGFSGLEILSSISASWCEFYTILVGVWNGKYWIELSRGDANANRDNSDETLLIEKRLPFTPQNNAIYTLSLEIIDGTTFNIKYNNELLLQYTDTSSLWQVNTGYSGYILLWSAASLRTTAHSLDISGISTTNLPIPPYDVNTMAICTTANPTTSPSQPTQPPTHKPTTPPTVATNPPSNPPSKSTTELPTNAPITTNLPTNDPSNHPTNDPSNPPTEDPTVVPTMDPITIAPTSAPTTPSTQNHHEALSTEATNANQVGAGGNKSFSIREIANLVGILVASFIGSCGVLAALFFIYRWKKDKQRNNQIFMKQHSQDQDGTLAKDETLDVQTTDVDMFAKGEPAKLAPMPMVERVGVTSMGADEEQSDSDSIFGTMSNHVTAKPPSEGDIFADIVAPEPGEVADEVALPDEENVEKEKDGNKVGQCTDCSQYKMGHVFDVDGLFYCDACFNSYEDVVMRQHGALQGDQTTISPGK